MSLKYKVDSLDGLDDSVKALYAEKDGAFVLDVEGVKGVDEIAGLEKTMRQERESRKEFERKLNRYGGKDPEEIEAMMQEYDALKAKQAKATKNAEDSEDLAFIKSKYDKQLKELSEKYETSSKELAAERDKSTRAKYRELVADMFAKKNLPATAVGDAVAVTYGDVKYSPDDNAFFSADGTPFGAVMDAYINSRPHLIPDSKGAGASGSNGNSGSVPREAAYQKAKESGDLSGMLKNAPTTNKQ